MQSKQPPFKFMWGVPKTFCILNCRSVIGRHPGTRLSPLHLDNTYDYGDTCTYFISLKIKVRGMITPFGGDVCGWFAIIIYRWWRALIPQNMVSILFFFSHGRNKTYTSITVIERIVHCCVDQLWCVLRIAAHTGSQTATRLLADTLHIHAQTRTVVRETDNVFDNLNNKKQKWFSRNVCCHWFLGKMIYRAVYLCICFGVLSIQIEYQHEVVFFLFF